MTIDFIVYDIASKKSILSLSVTADDPKTWRQVGHKIADAIYHRITGEAPFFDSKITYISETGPRSKRMKKLMLADWDGKNPKALTGGEKLVLTPRFSPNNHDIAYLSYEGAGVSPQKTKESVEFFLI